MDRRFPADRILAGAIALIGTANFALQMVLSVAANGGLVSALLVLTRFFTILTNAAVVVTMLQISAGRRVDRRVMLALTTAIAIVAAVYHTVLADLQSFRGLNAVTDTGFHTVIPALAMLWWLLFADRALRWRDVAWVLPFPVAYCLVALLRGAASGRYPYPFLDLPQIGPLALVANIAGLTLAFLLVGAMFAAIARLRPPSRGSNPRARA